MPALELESDGDRAIWFDGCVRTHLERDLQALSAISALPGFRRLMRTSCLRMGELVDQTDLGRDVALPQPTVRRYFNLLETSYLLVRLPACAVNRTKRLIKAPRLYWWDTGVAMHLAQESEPSGAHLENLVLHGLMAWRYSRVEQVELFYWRISIGQEVDFVVVTGDSLLPIVFNATTRPRLRDTAHLRTFRAEYGGRSRPELLLHSGDLIEGMTYDALAVPWWRVLCSRSRPGE